MSKSSDFSSSIIRSYIERKILSYLVREAARGTETAFSEGTSNSSIAILSTTSLDYIFKLSTLEKDAARGLLSSSFASFLSELL